MPALPDFKTLFDASPNAYLLLDTDLTIVEANKTFLQVTGREREEVLGRNIFDAFPGDSKASDEDRLRASFDRVLSTGQRDTLALVPYRISKETGPDSEEEERYWSVTHTPIFDDDGDVAFILQHTTDVTELYETESPEKRPTRSHSSEPSAQERESLSEESLDPFEEGVLSRVETVQKAYWAGEEERERLRRLFKQAPGFVAFMRGPEHIYELVNDAYCELVGRSDVVGKSIRDALPEVEGQGLFELLDQVYETGETVVGREVEVHLQQDLTEELETVYIDFVFQPVTSPGGNVNGIFVQGHDVTEKKQAMDRLHEHQEHLEELVEQRTRQVRELTSRVTKAEQRERDHIARLLHDDLQQHLYGVQLKMNSLRQNPPESKNKLLLGIKRLEDQVEEAIQTARRLSVGMSPPVLHSEGLTAALEWLKSHLEETRNLEMTLSAEGEFPMEEEMRVLLFQVTRELLVHASEHAEIDRATVTVREEDGDLMIEVADEGQWIDLLDLSETTTEEPLSLTASRERVRLFGGDLTIEKASEEGRQVTVCVPLKEDVVSDL